MAGSMKRKTELLLELIRRWFPERQILVRGSGAVHATTLKHSHQLAFVAAATLLILWSVASPLAVLVLWHGQATASHHAETLQAELQGTNSSIGAIEAKSSALVATANAAREESNQFTARAAQQLGSLDAQTRAAITKVDGIIAATGVNPKLVAISAPAPRETANDHAALLSEDLHRLKAVSDLLGEIPLAKPVSQMAISSPFGYRPDPWTGAREFHVGIDLRGPAGTPIYATAPGIVRFAGIETGYGEIVEIDHGYGFSTRYSHLDKILVHPGDKVALHQEVGLMGNTGWSTGPHLLYETRVDGEPINPLNFLKVRENVQD